MRMMCNVHESFDFLCSWMFQVIGSPGMLGFGLELPEEPDQGLAPLCWSCLRAQNKFLSQRVQWPDLFRPSGGHTGFAQSSQ